MSNGRPCSVCEHPKLRDITADLMARKSYRSIEAKFGVSKSSIDRHLNGHVSDAIRRLAAAESVALAEAATTAEPVLMEMRKLNVRSLRILQEAEAAKDHGVALGAIRECRRNLELIAKLTGELDPRAAGEVSGSPLQVTVVYADKALVTTGASIDQPGPARLTGEAPKANTEAFNEHH